MAKHNSTQVFKIIPAVTFLDFVEKIQKIVYFFQQKRIVT